MLLASCAQPFGFARLSAIPGYELLLASCAQPFGFARLSAIPGYELLRAYATPFGLTRRFTIPGCKLVGVGRRCSRLSSQFQAGEGLSMGESAQLSILCLSVLICFFRSPGRSVGDMTGVSRALGRIAPPLFSQTPPPNVRPNCPPSQCRWDGCGRGAAGGDHGQTEHSCRQVLSENRRG